MHQPSIFFFHTLGILKVVTFKTEGEFWYLRLNLPAVRLDTSDAEFIKFRVFNCYMMKQLAKNGKLELNHPSHGERMK